MPPETTAHVGERVTVDVPKRPTIYTCVYYDIAAKRWMSGIDFNDPKRRDKFYADVPIWHPVTIPGEDA